MVNPTNRGLIGQHKLQHNNDVTTFWNPTLEDGAQYVKISHVYKHPLYNDETVDHDICLLTTTGK